MAENRNAQQVREITDKLEQGIKELFESEKFKEYLTTMSKFYNYSFNNTLLIAMQKPDATLIAGYTSWQRNFDRHVMKGEKGIKILAPAPYKAQEEREKIDPATQKPVLDADGKPVTETVEVLRPAFKVVSVFDVSQTDGKELPDIAVDELTGSVENYAAFFEALKQESPVPISFEDIPGGAKGYFSHAENRIAIQEGMSEIQTVKTAIHEIAHAKLHAINPDEKVAPEERKDRHTKEVEAESVAYTVCQRYGIETSDYSFGYIAGWSSDKDTKELKGSLETIRSTAAEMIESIDAKLKVLLAEKSQEQTQEMPEPATEEKPSYLDVPVYREMANYAYEAGELDMYRASRDANMACKEAIEAAISENYVDYRLSTRVAVETVLEQFSEERVQYVLANTVQHNLHDGRYHAENKDWAGKISVCEENSESFIVSQVHPGLVNLFINQFKDLLPEKTQEQTETVSIPEPEKAAAPKHRLTPEEKKIKDAVMDTLKAQIAYSNDGMRATYKASEQSHKIMAQNKVKIEGNTVTQNGEPMFAIHRRYSAKKTQGCYRELTPTLEYIKKEKAQETKHEKPSIREQLKAAKAQSEKKAPTQEKKPKSKEMEI
jgi:antirestriction protein ArdC